MLGDKKVHFGVIGAVVTALCCFTPILVLLLAGVGIGWAIGYLDYVLLPALFFFVGLTTYALWQRSHASLSPDSEADSAPLSRLQAPSPGDNA